MFTRALYGTVAALYLFCFPYHSKLRSPNELCRLHQTRALVEYGSLDINQALRDFGPVGDLAVKDGRYYPSKAPLLSFAAVPVYGLLRLLGGNHLYAVKEVPLVYFARLFCTVLPTLLLLILLRRFLLTYLSPNVADAMVATYALGSLALSYSLLFMSHQTTAVLLFLSFYALWRTIRSEWKPIGYCAAGLCAGLSIAAEYTAALGVVGIGLYGVLALLAASPSSALPRALRLKNGIAALALACLGALPPLLLLGAYHWAAFGHPLETGYKHLADVAYQPWHQGGFWGIRTPEARAFVLSFFSPLRGLFALSPFLLLAPYGLYLQFRERKEPALFWMGGLLLVEYAYFTSSFSYDSWGWTTGPRHLTPWVPFLLLPVGLCIQRLSSLTKGMAAGLCTASIWVTAALTWVNYLPDDVSDGVFGLSLPLFRAGYWVPTALSAFGDLHGNAGAPALLLFLGASAGVVWLLRTGKRFSFALGTCLSVALVLALHAAAFKGDAHDQGALQFLKASWLTRP